MRGDSRSASKSARLRDDAFLRCLLDARFSGPLRDPVRPERISSAGQQRSFAFHRVHKVFDQGSMYVSVDWQILASAGINQLGTVQRTQLHFAFSAKDAALIPLHLRMPAHVHDAAYAIRVVDQHGRIVFHGVRCTAFER